MKLFVTHESALAYWVGPYARRCRPSERYRALPSGPAAGMSADLERLERLGLAINPLHFAVADPAQRPKRPGYTCHVMRGTIPAGAFEQLREDLWVAGPELTFCQAAQKFTFPQLVKLGYELCARFRVNTFLESIEPREPLTDPRKLRNFCERFSGRGAKAARAAARYVQGNTESPMEVALAMLLLLPRMYGGYGLPPAQPNAEIHIAPRGGRQLDPSYRGDLVWHKQRLIAEYDSDLYHSAPQKITDDAARRNNLQDANWRVVTVTSGQLRTPAKTDELADQLARALGVHNPYAAAETGARRVALRELLIPWAFPGFEGL